MLTHNRKAIDLNGRWKFCPDPMQRCRRQKWWLKEGNGINLFPCWNLDGLWDITVPGTWKTQFKELEWYDGHAVYVREFACPDDLEQYEAFLVFDGAVYEAEVYLNGFLVGKHDWGYSPFSFCVTELLRRDNRMFVLIDNHLRADRVPGEIFDWNNDGGLINPVKLVFVPKVYIENYRCATRLEGGEVELTFEVELASRNAGAHAEITLEIPQLGVRMAQVAHVGAQQRYVVRLPRDAVSLWSPDNPRLYEVRLTTDAEIIRDEVGFREIVTRGRDILLNGEKIHLYGVCVHSEFPGTGRTATAEGIALLVRQAKELGLNFLRCAHYPYCEEFGRAMDRAGLLWWEEVPAYWIFTVFQEPQRSKALGMLHEAIRRDWNRASLIVWSVSNECCYRDPLKHQENNYAYWRDSVAMVRELDPSRLLSCAESANHHSLRANWSPTNNDQFSDDYDAQWIPAHDHDWYQLFDILAGNAYVVDLGQAWPAYQNYARMLETYNKPLVISEFGSLSLRGSDLPADQLGSEERHAAMLREAYEAFVRLPQISGYAPWCMVDGRAPIHWRWYNSGKALYRYGLHDENWQPKQAFDVVREYAKKLLLPPAQ